MKFNNKLIVRLVTVFMTLFLIYGCGPTQKSVNRKLEKEALRAKQDNMNVMMEKYNREGWETDGTNSVKLSLIEHKMKMESGDYQEYKGSSDQAITKSQAISIAQANAYAEFAKNVSSIIQAKAEKISEQNKDLEDGVEAYQKFNDEVKQNAIVAANNFLEKSYVFVKKENSNSWSAEVMYLFNTNKDLDAMNEVLKKTLQNTKLAAKEKLWLKKLMDDLNK